MDVQITEVHKPKKKSGPKKDGRSTSRGALKRNSYTYSYRMDVLNEIKPRGERSQIDVAREHNIDRSLVSKWLKDKDNIKNMALNDHKKMYRKGRKSQKHESLYKHLILEFRKARDKGKMVNFSWLYTHASICTKRR